MFASHLFRRLSKRRSLRARESDRHSLTACPTQPVPTIFRPTNFLKTEMDRLDRPPGREFSRLRGVYVQKQRLMFVPAAEIGEELFDNATPLLDFLRHSTFGFRHFGASQMVPFETRPADAFLLLSGCRHDRSQAARSIERAFHKVAADYAKPFQTIQIVVRSEE